MTLQNVQLALTKVTFVLRARVTKFFLKENVFLRAQNFSLSKTTTLRSAYLVKITANFAQKPMPNARSVTLDYFFCKPIKRAGKIARMDTFLILLTRRVTPAKILKNALGVSKLLMEIKFVSNVKPHLYLT